MIEVWRLGIVPALPQAAIGSRPRRATAAHPSCARAGGASCRCIFPLPPTRWRPMCGPGCPGRNPLHFLASRQEPARNESLFPAFHSPGLSAFPSMTNRKKHPARAIFSFSARAHRDILSLAPSLRRLIHSQRACRRTIGCDTETVAPSVLEKEAVLELYPGLISMAKPFSQVPG